MVVPKVITEPAAEPVSRVDCQRHLRLDGAFDSPAYDHPDDEMIEAFLSAAREWAEAFTGMSLSTRTLEIALDEFPSAAIALPRGPVQSISSLTYIDSDGNEQTIATENYVLDDYGDKNWLLPADGYDWPATDGVINAVKVRYVAGFSLPDESPQFRRLPKSIRAALLLIVGHLYENRENSAAGVKVEDIPLGAQALLQPQRLNVGF